MNKKEPKLQEHPPESRQELDSTYARIMSLWLSTLSASSFDFNYHAKNIMCIQSLSLSLSLALFLHHVHILEQANN